MNLQRMVNLGRRQGTVERHDRPELDAPPSPRPTIRMTCRDILAETRDRLAARGFHWPRALTRSPRRGTQVDPTPGEPRKAGRV